MKQRTLGQWHATIKVHSKKLITHNRHSYLHSSLLLFLLLFTQGNLEEAKALMTALTKAVTKR